MSKPTHRETCRAMARLLLNEPWVDSVCWEIGVDGKQFDVLALTGEATEARARAGVERWKKRQAWHAARDGAQEPAPRPTVPRVLVGEVKMSRADLLAGIRRGQLDDYSVSAINPTHLLLVVWDDALTKAPGHTYWREADTFAALADLTEVGVPPTWGVARAHLNSPRRSEVCFTFLRRPPRIRACGELHDRLVLIERIARSLAYRVLGKDSPEQEQVEDHG